MNEKQWFAWLLALTVAAGAAVYYFLLREPEPVPVASAPPVAESPAAEPAPAPVASEPQYPLPPAAEAEAPLPGLGDSDGEFIDALSALLGSANAQRLLVPEHLIRRLVVAVDNLPRERVGLREWPVKPTPGSLVVQDAEGDTVLADDNGARYTLAVTVLKAVEVDALVRLYRHYYPLFQAAYREQGYPQGHFNDRLVQVIDHLLAAPTPAAPIRLQRPKYFYEFAEPSLEALSFGQKLMIRLGPENRAVVEDWLRSLRRRVTGTDAP
jgi:hypothetical protein